jgi:predicted nuclease of predicted toxin-antitoxin system
MKLLLDECTLKRLKAEFPDFETQTVEDAGLKGFKDAKLLEAAALSFDALITVDQNIPFQQNTAKLDLGIVILRARQNSYRELAALVPRVLETLKTIQSGEVVIVSSQK